MRHAILLTLFVVGVAATVAPSRAAAQPEPPIGGDVPVVEPPVWWTEWEVTGTFLEPPATVRTMLEPRMASSQPLTPSARTDLAAACAVLGYQLVELATVPLPGNTARLSLHLEPIPMIRSVDIDLHQSMFDAVLDDQVRRRLRLGPGTYLPWALDKRRAAMDKEELRVEEYLRDEGFFDARATIKDEASVPGGVRLSIDVNLGSPYFVGAVDVDTGGGTAVSPGEVRTMFRHRSCYVWVVCFGNRRFTREQLRKDLEAVVALYKQRGYPAVRVQSNFEPATSIDRKSRTVRFNVFIDQRRQLDVVFEGNDASKFDEAALRAQLTFDVAGSADDLEAAESATALAAAYQARGYFDTQVSWRRERFDAFDRVVFRIDQGPRRTVRRVEFDGNQALGDGALAAIVATKVGGSSSLFADASYATGGLLASDVERIQQAYAARGYQDVVATAHAAPLQAGTASAALTAAVVAAERNPNDLYVRFQIAEGDRTDLAMVQVSYAGARRGGADSEEQFARCRAALTVAGTSLGTRIGPATRTELGCRAVATDLPFDPSTLPGAASAVRDDLWNAGYPNATVEANPLRDGPRRHRAVLDLRITEGPSLRVGTVVIRGNFRTRESIVRSQLGFTEGQVLTAAMLSGGPADVRATGLFDSVTLELASGDEVDGAPANFVVRVRERYDRRLQIDFEAGYSTQSGRFGKVKLATPNLLGIGLYTDLALTGGDRYSAIEGTGRMPRWLVRQLLPIGFDTQLLGFYRLEEPARFGALVTKGFTVAFARTWERQRSKSTLGRLVTANLRYDFRQRNRDEDPFRAAGPDADLPPVPVNTRTGSIGFNLRWDQGYDRDGNLNPLAPERGFILEADASLASPALAGQDVFVKLSASGKRFQPIGRRLTLSSELRVDQGIPLAGAVLLPEVERFFGGGDNTVRGYEDDRLATEIVESGVPPFTGVTQFVAVPRGGNIRAFGSVDLQLALFRGWSVGNFASALFVDAGFVRNSWAGLEPGDVRPAIGVAPIRFVSPIGTATVEYAFPLDLQRGDDARGRLHFGVALRL